MAEIRGSEQSPAKTDRHELLHDTEVEFELVKQRFTPDASGRCPQPYSEIQKNDERLGSIGESTLTRAIQSAFKSGRVRISVTRGVATRPVRRDPAHEAKLKDQFSLNSAIVVDTGHDQDECTPSESDDVHRLLGIAAADVISSGSFIEDGESVALAGGRGVFHTVSSLAEKPKFNAKEVSLCPMTGALYPQHYSGDQNVRLDADYHVQLLAGCFRYPVEMQFISFPCVFPQQNKIKAYLKNGAWRRPATLAIAGLGILSGGHRVYQLVEKGQAADDPFLKPIYKDLESLVRLCRSSTMASYCPVADIANRMIFVPPPSGHTVPAESQTRILDLIAKINRKLIGFDDDQIRAVKSVFLVAGTVRKAAALHYMLKTRIAKSVCTDLRTARKVCSLRS